MIMTFPPLHETHISVLPPDPATHASLDHLLLLYDVNNTKPPPYIFSGFWEGWLGFELRHTGEDKRDAKKRRVSWFYEPSIGDYYYGHPHHNFLSDYTYSRHQKPFNLGEYCPVFDARGPIKLNRRDSDIPLNWAGGLHNAKKVGFSHVNDPVLGILELLKVHRRVLYVDIDVRHGDDVEEFFFTTDRVMTVSFKNLGDFCPGTEHIGDVGSGSGKNYALNIPLNDGMDDESFLGLFRPIMEKVMENYQPEAVVLQCGADSLSGDRLEGFNLSVKGHADCLCFLRSYNVPLIVLCGRSGCYETVGHTGNRGGNKRKSESFTSTRGGPSKYQKGNIGGRAQTQAQKQADAQAKRDAKAAKDGLKALKTDRRGDVKGIELAFTYTRFFESLNPSLTEVEDFTVHGCWALEEKRDTLNDFTTIELPLWSENEFKNNNNTGIYAAHTYTFKPSQNMKGRMMIIWPALSKNWTNDEFWLHEWVKHGIFLAHIWGCQQYFEEVLAKGEEMTVLLRDVIRRKILESPGHSAEKGYTVKRLIEIFMEEFDHIPKIKTNEIKGANRLVEVSFMFELPNGDDKWKMTGFLEPDEDTLDEEVFF